MTVAVVYSRALVGLRAVLVKVEVHVGTGLPSTTLVGLPATVVRESKDRVRSAISASGFTYPAGRITINLAPAELPKEGGRFDLPIAIGILAAALTPTRHRAQGTEIVGELSLDGAVREVSGALPCAMAAAQAARTLVLPFPSAPEAARAKHAELAPVITLLEAWDLFCSRETPRHHIQPEPDLPVPHTVDLADVRGQRLAKRALEIAAAGGHHLLLLGPPGTGKTMLASRIPTILPPMREREALETASVYSVARQDLDRPRGLSRPMRAPHHTTSTAGLIGGGSQPRPGEISLAHNGVLFLDELGEFPRNVLEALREPLESGRVVVARARAHAEYPARFQLIAAMNPCPCGYFADGTGRCHCPEETVRRYQARVSGPLLDRIDIQLELTPARRRPLSSDSEPVAEEPSAHVHARVLKAYQHQLNARGRLNRDLDEADLKLVAALDPASGELLDHAIDKLGLSERGVGRIRRVARTIADLARAPDISPKHLSEAINLRRLERRM